MNGVDVESKVFATAADAQTFFSDNAIDLGSLASGNSLTMREILTVTTSNANSGFYGNVIIGDPPPAAAAPHAAAAHRRHTPQRPLTGHSGSGRSSQFVQALAGFGGQPVLGGDPITAVMRGTRIVLGAAAAKHDSMFQHFVGHP